MKSYKLGEIASFFQGKQVDLENQFLNKDENHNVRFVRIVDYTNSDEPIRYIENLGEKYYAREGDLVMIRYGSQTAGKVVMGKSGIIANNMFKINLDNTVANNEFMYYYLSQPHIFDYLRRAQSSSTMPAINFGMLNNFEVMIPNIDIQEKIVSILKKLDDRIKINTQINDNLSEQLQLIYDEWFGKYETDSLPDGWKVEKLKNIATLSQGVQVPIDKQIYEEKSGYTRFIRIVDITQENDKDIRYIEDTERGKVEENEIFMIRYGTPGILSWNYKGIIANNLFKITPKMNCISSNFLYSYFNNNKFQRYIRGNATSSTMPAIKFSTLNDRDIIIPTTDLIEKFNNISETIRLKQLSISNQNKTLSNLKDILLPKLMNGEIDLDKIEI